MGPDGAGDVPLDFVCWMISGIFVLAFIGGVYLLISKYASRD